MSQPCLIICSILVRSFWTYFIHKEPSSAFSIGHVSFPSLVPFDEWARPLVDLPSFSRLSQGGKSVFRFRPCECRTCPYVRIHVTAGNAGTNAISSFFVVWRPTRRRLLANDSLPKTHCDFTYALAFVLNNLPFPPLAWFCAVRLYPCYCRKVR